MQYNIPKWLKWTFSPVNRYNKRFKSKKSSKYRSKKYVYDSNFFKI